MPYLDTLDFQGEIFDLQDRRLSGGETYSNTAKVIGNDYVESGVVYPATAGMLSFCWSAVSNSGLRYTFTLSDGSAQAHPTCTVPSGALVSIKAKYSWSFAGTLVYEITTSSTQVVVDVFRTPASNWKPEDYIDDIDNGYLWFPEYPQAGVIPKGNGAISLGEGNRANEEGATAFGRRCIADGRYSVVGGRENKVAYAGLAGGAYNEAMALFNSVSGHTNWAYGNGAHAEGYCNTAGLPGVTVSGQHAEGGAITYLRDTTSASGLWSSSKSYSKEAQVVYNQYIYVACKSNSGVNPESDWGQYNGAPPNASWRLINVANGRNAHKEGTAGAYGNESHAGGQYSIVMAPNGAVSHGLFNYIDTNGSASVVEGKNNYNSGIASETLGQSNTNSGNNSILTGYGNNNSGSSAIVSGYNNTNSGGYAVVNGQNNVNSGAYSISVGGTRTDTVYDATVSYAYGDVRVYEGVRYFSAHGSNKGNTPPTTLNSTDYTTYQHWIPIMQSAGQNSITVGTTSAQAHYSAVFGQGNLSTAQQTFVAGQANVATAQGSALIGQCLINGSSLARQLVIGKYNAVSAAPFVIGQGTGWNLRKNIATVDATGNLHLHGKVYIDDTNADGSGGTLLSNYSLPTATSLVLGGVKLGSDSTQSVSAQAISSIAGRTYLIQKNSAGQMVVNVPWTDSVGDPADYGYCETAATTAAKTVTIPGITSITTGTTIKVKFKNYNGNGANNPTLKVNDLTAYPIYVNYKWNSSTQEWDPVVPGTGSVTSWENGAVMTFTFDGTAWMMTDRQGQLTVQSTATTGNDNYRVILSGSANDSTEYSTLRKTTAASLMFNPSTKVITWAGHKVSIGTTMPPSPSAGDIWFDLN